MTRRQRLRRRLGFTLIEILVALAVTALGLTAIAAMFTANASGTSFARHATEATVLGEDCLELMLLTRSDQLASGNDRVDAQGMLVGSGGFTRTWTVAWEGDLARIGVTVRWHEGAHDRELVFRTLRAR